MQNAIPRMDDAAVGDGPGKGAPEVPAASAQDVALRSLAGRLDSYTDEVDRLLRAGQTVMQRTQSVTPRVSDIVREAGLSNQAFYRHFRGRDELLLALLRSGQRALVGYVAHLMAKECSDTGKVRRWMEAILAQAADPGAAEATSPFVRNSRYLAGRFPEEVRRADEGLRALLLPLLARARDAGVWPTAQPERDSQALYQLAMGTMQSWLLAGFRAGAADIAHVVEFGLAGLDRPRRHQVRATEPATEEVVS